MNRAVQRYGGADIGAVAGERPVLRLGRRYMEVLHIGIIVFRTATAHTMAEIGAIPTLAGVTGVMKDEWLQFESVQRAMQSSGGTVGTQAEMIFNGTTGGSKIIGPLRV